ncbi:MAG: DUF924 domain-containing protein [Marinibacterium sp.]|nr:DUF924 domain-containing protein [Marinibacterium sp.]
MTGPDTVLEFWFNELEATSWFMRDDALDAQIRTQFHDLWQRAADGDLMVWQTTPEGALAYVILTDQFPRNMFRTCSRAFSTDHLARAAAKAALDKEWDLRVAENARQFLYMPLMHSENLCDQERCVRMICGRAGADRDAQLLHARAHREEIRQFGRFPARNDAIGRPSTPAESDYLASGGYGSMVRDLQRAA